MSRPIRGGKNLSSPPKKNSGEVHVEAVAETWTVVYIDTTTMSDFELVAYIMGSATLEAAGTDDGAALVGSLEGTLMTWGR